MSMNVGEFYLDDEKNLILVIPQSKTYVSLFNISTRRIAERDIDKQDNPSEWMLEKPASISIEVIAYKQEVDITIVDK